MRKILEIANPIVKSYPSSSNPTAIILTRENTYPWLLNNFIQLIGWHKKTVDYGDFDYRKCPLIDYQRVNGFFVKKLGGIVDFLIDAINNEFYAYFIINTRYINAYNTTKDRPHDVLVFGYDLNNKLFYIADNFRYGKYGFEICSFSELNAAYEKLSKNDQNYLTFNNSIELLSYKAIPDSHLYFDMKIFKQSLEDYISARPVHQKYPLSSFPIDRERHSFGLDVYDILLEDLNNYHVIQDIRSFHVFMEHKEIMLRRLHYITDNRIIKNQTNILNDMEEIKKNSQIIRNTLLKYRFTRNKDLINKMKVLLQETKRLEFNTLESLISSISLN